jgi:hypothetical protein
MAYQMRRESVDFLQTAPVILRYTTDVAAAQTAVFAELSGDPANWRHWFPGVRDGAYDSPPPHGVGSLRRVRVRGAGTYRETIVAWEEPRAWGWRVDATTLPLATALLEHWALEPAGNGTRITWTFAVDPKPWFRLGLSAMPGVMERVFRTAMRNLERRLRT